MKNTKNMKAMIGSLLFLLTATQFCAGQAPPPAKAEQEVIALSRLKWTWMADKNVDSLNVLFDAKAMFVHMGGSWGKDQEINIIRSGGIHYKKADVHSVSVNIIGNTAILLNQITLLAVVGGNEVTNEFMVTEVYVKQNNKWGMGSLSFSKLSTPGGGQR